MAGRHANVFVGMTPGRTATVRKRFLNHDGGCGILDTDTPARRRLWGANNGVFTALNRDAWMAPKHRS